MGVPDVGVPAPRTHISLCSGIGALDLAIERVFPQIKCLCYVENGIENVLRLATNMEAGRLSQAAVWTELRSFPIELFRDRTDMVAAGFPCQDISNAGRRGGIRALRSGLFFAVAGVIRQLRPRYVVLENVSAITIRGLSDVQHTLAQLGYDTEWGCLRASDVGAPHRRDRWWCLAWDRRQLADAEGRRRSREPWVSRPRGALVSTQPGPDGRALDGPVATGVP